MRQLEHPARPELLHQELVRREFGKAVAAVRVERSQGDLDYSRMPRDRTWLRWVRSGGARPLAEAR